MKAISLSLFRFFFPSTTYFARSLFAIGVCSCIAFLLFLYGFLSSFLGFFFLGLAFLYTSIVAVLQRNTVFIKSDESGLILRINKENRIVEKSLYIWDIYPGTFLKVYTSRSRYHKKLRRWIWNISFNEENAKNGYFVECKVIFPSGENYFQENAERIYQRAKIHFPETASCIEIQDIFKRIIRSLLLNPNYSTDVQTFYYNDGALPITSREHRDFVRETVKDKISNILPSFSGLEIEIKEMKVYNITVKFPV